MLFMALLQRFSFILLFITLVGCGGSSGGFDDTSEGTDEGTSPDTITISLAISDRNLSQATPRRLTVIVMQGNLPLADKLVTFSVSNEDLASFNTDVNTSSTDINGKAEIGLIAGVSSGDGSITASAEGMSSNSVTFTSAGDGDVVGQPVASAVSLFASSQQIASSGDDDVTLITIAVTGSDGKASAILKTNNEPTNRLIKVTSTSGQVTDSVDVQVIGTSINLTGSSSLAINDENSFFIQVLDSESEPIPNTRVELSLVPPTSGNVADISFTDSVVTDNTGQANLIITGVSGGTNTLVASALGVTTKHAITVQADSFLFSSFDNGQEVVVPDDNTLPDVFLSDTATIELTWKQSNVAIADGTNVNFTSTRGGVSPSTTTILNGKATTTITSNNAGKALVTVTGTDDGITLSNQLEFEFVAENVAMIDAQASPNSIAPNGDTSNISVVVKDVEGNLVKGKTIDFSLSDTSSGSILPASVVTDSNGTASTVYTSNTVSSQNGISITAKVKEEPSIFDTVTLTVADRNLFITLGTGNELIEVDSTTFNKQYVAFVTDVDSASPAKNTVLTVSAVPRSYYKGYWDKSLDESGTFEQWVTIVNETCSNEDSNFDGFLGSHEDINEDGNLTPGNVAAVLGEVTTDEQGRALIDVKYPQNYGGWINIDLIVSAKVGGTESSKQVLFTLPASLEDVLNEDTAPPQGSSPLGISDSCTDSN